MTSMIRRSTYASVLLFSAQSFNSSSRMATELAKMLVAGTHASTLSAKSASDLASSSTYAEKAKVDKFEAESLHAHAIELELESEKDVALAKADRVEADEFTTKAVSEETEADASMAEATAEEALFLEEREKGLAETAEAAREHAETETDAFMTGFCEFIPFVDLVCDVIGSVAAVGLESNAVKLTAQSAVDLSTAIAAKVKEDEAVAQMEVLHAKAASDEEASSGLSAKADEEEMKATEERLESEREEAQSEELFVQSREEIVLAEEEAAKGEEEATEEEVEMNRSLKHGLAACYHAVMAGLLSFMSMTYFAIRFLVAVIIPGGAAMVGFIPTALSMSQIHQSRNLSLRGETQIVGAGSHMIEFGKNAWNLLPKQEMTYFGMHCSVFITTLIGFQKSCGFSEKFQGLDKLDIRSRGGAILVFAVVAACLQGFLLHSMPRLLRGNQTDIKGVRNASLSELEHISWRIIGAAGVLLHSMVYLLPLFIMEAVELWLLAGKYIFTIGSNMDAGTVPSPSYAKSFMISTFLFLSALLYTYAFHHSGRAIVKTVQIEETVVQEGKNGNRSSSDHSDVNEILPLLGNAHLPKDKTTTMMMSYSSRDQSYSDNWHNSEEMIMDVESSEMLSDIAILEDQPPIATLISTTVPQVDSNLLNAYKNQTMSAFIAREEESSISETVNSALHQYIIDLKLPFEILVMTCMFVKLQECVPILWELFPQIVKGHAYISIEIGGIILLISLVFWFLVKSNHSQGHVGIWTGRLGTFVI
uniref:Uncharacterized protein n=1 Tax=Chaetoceros debilis TaxID=122233 RepID=A0A7S3QD52_9STRA|mmetsp:Transcript_29892/g.45746  ORF Transcript_29892/g.45746 Transcript_29892/m.45746 type:complete len:763 (+) Transcript_29892:214-2502(+)